MINAAQKRLLEAYPNIGMLPVDPDSVGDTLFTFMWRELADAGETPENAISALDVALSDIEAVRAAIAVRA